jgi:hypothetical protein
MARGSVDGREESWGEGGGLSDVSERVVVDHPTNKNRILVGWITRYARQQARPCSHLRFSSKADRRALKFRFDEALRPLT